MILSSKMNDYSKAIIVSIFIFYSCKDIDRKKNVSIISNKIFLKEIKDRNKTTNQILDKFSESILLHSKIDTSTLYYGSDIIDDEGIFRQLLIGKFVDDKSIIATEVNLKDTLINFYRLDNTKWMLIGSEKTNIPIYKIDFEDLDGDLRNEIITSTSPNMNGNSWKEVYHYSTNTNSLKYAGSFSTDYEVKKNKKQIEETYEGSWYMDMSKTLYEWRNEKLVPIKKIILAHKKSASEDEKLDFEYYENLTSEIDGLKLKFKEPYNDNKKQEQLWNNFFSEH